MDERVRDALEEMLQRVEDLKGQHRIPANEVFTPDFMQQNTSSEDLAEFLNTGGFEVGEEEGLEAAVSEDALDRHVRETTSFDSWEDMKEDAEKAWILGKLRR